MLKGIKQTIAIIFCVLLGAGNVQAATNDKYTIFIDGGSTGSRLYLFEYDPTAAIPELSIAFSSSDKPGLSSYADHPEQASTAVQKILDDAAAYLGSHGIAQTSVPVSIMATAGMRLLPDDKQQAIYQNVRAYMTAHYQFPIQDIKTITGQMEALYGWLDVNYLLGTFQNHQRTVGSADVGGASAEIAFATNEQTQVPSDIVNVTIGGHEYRVYAVSFLGLGQDQIREAMNQTANAPACYPPGYQLNNTVNGAFNFNTCASTYLDLIARKLTKTLPITQGTSFVAYSGIYYDYTFFDPDTRPNDITLEEHINNICSQQWDSLKTQYPDVPEKYLSTDCANGVFIERLIYKEYHLTDDDLTISNQINHQDIDWTLGAALYSLLPQT